MKKGLIETWATNLDFVCKGPLALGALLSMLDDLEPVLKNINE